jgi:hypothetical protein
VDLEGVLARVEELVAAHGAVPPAELRPLRRHLPALAPRLRAKGYEVGSTVRRPLASQLLALVQRGVVPQKGIERRVAGASAREVKVAIERLVASGEIAAVVRDVGPGIAPAGSDVISGAELELFHRRLVQVERLVRRARARARGAARSQVAPGVLREDVLVMLGPPQEASDAPPGAAQSGALVDALSREIRRRMTADARPIRVPDVLRAVGGPTEAAKRALLDGAARGLFELEPESGMGRLSREDAALCPTGPMGTLLSWIVARDGERLQ